VSQPRRAGTGPAPTPGGDPRLLAVLVLASLLVSCFEEPVVEQLELRFAAAGPVEVTAQVTLRVPQGETGHARLLARLAALEAIREGQSWQREAGRLQWFRQWATAEDPARLSDFFADTPVQVFFQRGESTAEIALVPGSGSRATAEERKRVLDAISPWGDAVAAYEQAAFAVWGHLEAHPGRRRACVGKLFSLDLAEGVADALPPLSPDEEALLEALGETMDGVTAVLQVPAEEGETFEELARRVYDPYPARVRLVVTGRVLAAEGLTGKDLSWETLQRSPWGAFAALAGRWVGPDPLLARVEQQRRAGDAPFDLDGFLARRFRVATVAPTATEVRQAIAAALAPPGPSRLVWEPGGAAPDTSH
jgi:hypothetical protein